MEENLKEKQISLAKIKNIIGPEYGAYAVKAILLLAITEVSTFFNVGKNMDRAQTSLTADMIMETYGDYSVQEIKSVFRANMRTAKVFDRIDGNIILGWLADYDIRRTEAVWDAARQRDSQAANEANDSERGISLSDYMNILRTRAEKGDEDAAARVAEMDEISTRASRDLSVEDKRQQKIAYKQFIYNNYKKSKL